MSCGWIESAVKPSTVLVTKVTIKGAKQAVQMFGPAQFAVAKAVADSVGEGIIPKDQAEDLVIICGVFIHWEAEDNKKIYDYNYEATKQAIATALQGKPTVDDVLAKKDSADHPFKGFWVVRPWVQEPTTTATGTLQGCELCSVDTCV